MPSINAPFPALDSECALESIMELIAWHNPCQPNKSDKTFTTVCEISSGLSDKFFLWSYHCRIRPYTPFQVFGTDALRSFSTGNREMRDIAMPKLFAEIDIQGNWDIAENVIGCLHANPGLCEHVR